MRGSSLHEAASTDRDSVPARATEHALNKRDSIQLMFGCLAMDLETVTEMGGTGEALELDGLVQRLR